jgi:copper chaperone
MHGYTDDKDALLKRLRRVEGQVSGLQRMVDEDAYCIDVLSTRTYSVDGMTCGHCVAAITGEVTKVPGVTGVDVSLEARTVTVTGDAGDDAVREAIDEAGYTVVAS